MPAKRPSFLAVAAELFALSFAIGFFIALFSLGASGVLFKFALSWELTNAALSVAAWAPAILLAASALSAEASPPGSGFAEAAKAVMFPAFALAAIVSIFYLLIVPDLQGRKNRYEGQSQLFHASLALAETALGDGRLDDADRALIACAAIDPRDERYVALYDRVRSAELKALARSPGEGEEPRREDSEGAAWATGNRFYLEALEARQQGRLLDAHYLAKRSAAVYSRRPEVRKLVDDTWRELQALGLSGGDEAKAAFYSRKLEGYERFQEGDFLSAYRIFLALSQDDPSDTDAATYLERSAVGLDTLAFFIEEDERAFSRADERGVRMSLGGPSGWKATLSAARAASLEDAVYLRDMELRIEGTEELRVSAPFARLHATTLILRAVDRRRPDMVWEPDYEQRPVGASKADPGYALALPFGQAEVARALRLSGAPGDIPIADLALGLPEAARLGLPVEPLLVELAGRAGYPFAVLMLALLGAGLGLRFKPTEPVGTVARIVSAPVLVALAIPPLRALRVVADVLARVLAALVPPGAFLASWLLALGVCALASLLVAARIAGRESA